MGQQTPVAETYQEDPILGYWIFIGHCRWWISSFSLRSRQAFTKLPKYPRQPHGFRQAATQLNRKLQCFQRATTFFCHTRVAGNTILTKIIIIIIYFTTETLHWPTPFLSSQSPKLPLAEQTKIFTITNAMRCCSSFRLFVYLSWWKHWICFKLIFPRTAFAIILW